MADLISQIKTSDNTTYDLQDKVSTFGGTNFILSSNKIIGGGNASGITSSYESDGSLKVVSTSGNENYKSISFAQNSNDNVGANLAIGDIYTISVMVKVESGTTLPTLFINQGNGYKQLKGTIVQNQWIQAWYSSTWANPNPGTSYGNIALHLGFSSAIGTYYFKNFKLEKGSKPTQWTPAPQDLAIYTSSDETIEFFQ